MTAIEQIEPNQTKEELEKLMEKAVQDDAKMLLEELLATIPQQEREILKLEDVKFGIVDRFLLSKNKPDVNGIRTNIALIKSKWESLHGLLDYFKADREYKKNDEPIIYRPVNNGYHWKLIKTIDMNDLDKYLIIM